MASNLNFKNFGNDPPGDGGSGGGRLPNGFPLARQTSVYSLTFDEFQSTVGGVGKDFGSLNMDELLKNIWSAEESHHHNLGSTSGGAGQEGSGYLQRQGSMTLPRTLSHKTVDEVWRNMSKEYGGGKDAGGGIGGFGVPQRQPTLGEITIEEFLMRAGVMREESQLAQANNLGLLGELSHHPNSSGLEFEFQQQQTQTNRNASLMSGGAPESSNQIALQSVGNLPLNGFRSAANQMESQQMQKPQQPQQILPKQPALAAYGTSMGIPSSGQLSSPRIMGGIAGMSSPVTSTTLVQSSVLQDGGLRMVGLGANGVTVATGSPALSSDGFTKSNGDVSSVSPVPYIFNGGLRGRRNANLEKAVERRQRRMIKNRESAARSRARKQAYTMELEAEVAKLKTEQELLQKKQEEMVEMQKNQELEMLKHQNGDKRQCLRRTQTGPW